MTSPESTAPNETLPEPTGPINWMVVFLWILVPALVYFAAEDRFRGSSWDQTFGWHTIPAVTGGKHIDSLFFGTSRTAAAVCEEDFAQRVANTTGQPHYAYNMGAGETRLVFHYFGLRNLYKDSPRQLKGTTLFIEAPSGLPEYMFWTDAWIYPRAERNLIPVLRDDDLSRLWRADESVEKRLDLSIRYLLWSQRLFSMRHVFRHESLALGAKWMEGVLLHLGARAPESQSGFTEEELRIRGGIQADPAITRDAERVFKKYCEREKNVLNRPWQRWQDTILQDIVDLVHANGGHVVFFEVPQPTIFNRIYGSSLREKDRAVFRAWADQVGATLVRADFVYTDADFPDNFHLAASLCGAYSTSLADAYVMEMRSRTLPEGAK
jgi:hypothetical protein